MQFYHYPRGCCALAADSLLAPPWGTQSHSKSQLCPQCAQRCARERPKTQKTDLWGAKGAKRCQNGAKMEANGSPKCAQNRGFEKKVPKVVWTHYVIYIFTTGTLQKPYFFIPPSNANAGLFRGVPRMPPRGCKMAPTGPKNGESVLPRDSQGCQRLSQCLLKCSKKT